MLKEIDDQIVALEHFKIAPTKTSEFLNSSKMMIRKKMTSVLTENEEVIKNYAQSIENLKRIEIHSLLKKEGKSTLMDIYYDEAQMNKWRDSCFRA